MTSIGDKPAETEAGEPEILSDGFRRMVRYRSRHRGMNGEWSGTEVRDLHEGAKVVAVVALDRPRDRLVLIRQYRLASHLAADRGELVEVVAGGVEEGEDAETAARRELLEETGLRAQSLRHCFDFMASPGITTEYTSVFLAEVDSTEMAPTAGSDEDEDIVPLAVPLDEALAAFDEGRIVNGFLQLCILWLAREQAKSEQA